MPFDARTTARVINSNSRRILGARAGHNVADSQSGVGARGGAAYFSLFTVHWLMQARSKCRLAHSAHKPDQLRAPGEFRYEDRN